MDDFAAKDRRALTCNLGLLLGVATLPTAAWSKAVMAGE